MQNLEPYRDVSDGASVTDSDSSDVCMFVEESTDVLTTPVTDLKSIPRGFCDIGKRTYNSTITVAYFNNSKTITLITGFCKR